MATKHGGIAQSQGFDWSALDARERPSEAAWGKRPQARAQLEHHHGVAAVVAVVVTAAVVMRA